LLKRFDKGFRLARDRERLVIFLSFGVKVGGQIAVRVAILVGSHDPDFSTAHLVTHGF
jgi:hypothetical protein